MAYLIYHKGGMLFGILLLFLNVVKGYAHDISAVDQQVFAREILFALKDSAAKLDKLVVDAQYIIAQREQEKADQIYQYGINSLTESDKKYYNLTLSQAEQIRRLYVQRLEKIFAYVRETGVQDFNFTWSKITMDSVSYSKIDEADSLTMQMTLFNKKEKSTLILDQLTIANNAIKFNERSKIYFVGNDAVDVIGKKFTYAFKVEAIDDLVRWFMPTQEDMIYLTKFIPNLSTQKHDNVSMATLRAELINKMIEEFDVVITEGKTANIDWSGIKQDDIKANLMFVNFDLDKGPVDLMLDYNNQKYLIGLEQVVELNGKPYFLGGISWKGKVK